MINPMELHGRTILVTGASSGIGQATCILLSQLGAKLVLVARNHERLVQTVNLLDGDGHRIECFDLTKVDDIPVWLHALRAETDPLSGLVHSAGIQITRPLAAMNSEDLHEIFQINVNAAVGLAKGFRHKRVVASCGAIVFISSVMGLVGQPGVSAYAASKGAVLALTKSLALELARQNIRVNCVVPAHVETDMSRNFRQFLTPEQIANVEALHPLGTGEAKDVAYAIAFLLADTSRWITGTSLIVDGGYTAQ